MWHFTKIDVDINEVISEEHAEVSHAALTLALLPCARTKLIVCSMSLRLWNVFYILCEYLVVFHLNLANSVVPD